MKMMTSRLRHFLPFSSATCASNYEFGSERTVRDFEHPFRQNLVVAQADEDGLALRVNSSNPSPPPTHAACMLPAF